MTKHSEYMTIEQALDVAYESGQFWELHPNYTITGDEFDDEGDIYAEVELTSHAAITDIELNDEGYLLTGNQLGERFNIEATIDGDTLVRLVDAR